MNKQISFSAIIDGVSKKKDATLSIKLGTQELSPEDTAKIFEMGNKQIYVAFAETEITKLDIPEEMVEFPGDKSPSERLRGVLYVYWDTKTDKKKSFDEFRKDYMEKIISNVKDKLD